MLWLLNLGSMLHFIIHSDQTGFIKDRRGLCGLWRVVFCVSRDSGIFGRRESFRPRRVEISFWIWTTFYNVDAAYLLLSNFWGLPSLQGDQAGMSSLPLLFAIAIELLGVTLWSSFIFQGKTQEGGVNSKVSLYAEDLLLFLCSYFNTTHLNSTGYVWENFWF